MYIESFFNQLVFIKVVFLNYYFQLKLKTKKINMQQTKIGFIKKDRLDFNC